MNYGTYLSMMNTLELLADRIYRVSTGSVVHVTAMCHTTMKETRA
jgi:hypothetical protein